MCDRMEASHLMVPSFSLINARIKQISTLFPPRSFPRGAYRRTRAQYPWIFRLLPHRELPHSLHCHRSVRGRLDALCSRRYERRLYLVGSGRELVLAKSFRVWSRGLDIEGAYIYPKVGLSGWMQQGGEYFLCKCPVAHASTVIAKCSGSTERPRRHRQRGVTRQ